MQPEGLAWGADGFLPVIIQDATTNEVLTLAYANRDALEQTIATGMTVLYSRSRQALWRKGETSGNVQQIESVTYDCDADALLYRVHPKGPACHTGRHSCFGPSPLAAALADLERVLESRKREAPQGSYVGHLYERGINEITKKVGEEAVELIVASKDDAPEHIVWEAADLLFHTLVLLTFKNVALDRVGAELLRRAQSRTEPAS